MKKNLLLVLCIIFIFISCNKNSLTNSYWIAVKSYPIPPETGNNIYDAITIHLTDNKLVLGYVYDKRSENFDLKFDDNRIFLNDTLWAVIFKEYRDSLFLDIRNNARVKFVKLGEKHKLEAKPKVWEHKNWILSYNDFKRELILTDSLFFDEPDSKLCIQKDLQDNQFISTIDKWKVVSVNENQLFVKTFYQRDDELYRIKNYIDDSIIELESLKFPEVKTNLTKRKYISDSKKQEIINQIQNHIWKIHEVLNLDTISRGHRDRGYALMKLESLKDKEISFKFSDNATYNIYESDISVANGKWKLSQTGNELVLDNGIYPSNYIDLINVSIDSLVIGNLRIFKPEEFNYGMDIEIYYKVSLKK